MQPPLPSELLLSQAELLNDCSVTLDILLLQVCEHAAALAYHLQQTTTGMIVLLMGLEVLGKVVDALGEKSDLNLGGTGIALMKGKPGDDLVLAFFFHYKEPPVS